MSRCKVLVLAGLLSVLVSWNGRATPSQPDDDDEGQIKRPVLLDPYGDRLPAGALARMGTVRFRHGSPMCNLLFSPNGKILATLGADHKIRLWDFASGQELRELAVPMIDNQMSMAFSPDGKHLAMCSGNPRIFLWDLNSGKELHRFENLQIAITSLAFSGDGKTLATTGNNMVVNLWDVTTGKETGQLQWKKEEPKPEKENGLIRAIKAVKELVVGDNEAMREQFFNAQTITYSADGKLLAVGGYDGGGQGKIRVWDAAKGKQLHEWSGQQGSISKVVFSPNNKVLASLADNQASILLLDTATGKELRKHQVASGMLVSFAFSPDSKTLVYAGQGDGVRIMEVASGKELRHLEGTKMGIFSLAFTPDGKTLAAGGQNNLIQMWDTATWRELRHYGGHDAAVSSVAFSPDGKRILTTSSDRTIRVWDSFTGKEIRKLPGTDLHDDQQSSGSAFSPDGRLLATSTMKIDPNNQQAQEGQVRLWDLDTGKLLRKFGVPEVGVGSLAIAPGNRLLASAWFDGVIRIWDVTTGKEVRQFRFFQQENPEEVVQAGNIALTFSPDGKLLATRESKPAMADDDDVELYEVNSQIKLWEVASGKVRRQLQFKGLPTERANPRVLFNRFALAVNDLIDDSNESGMIVFSPDGKILALPSYETIHLFNLVNGKELRRVGGHQVNAGTATFSPDGRMIAAGTFDGSIRVWEVATGTVLCEFGGHRNTIHTMRFSADGKQLVTGGADTTALVWDVLSLVEDNTRTRTPELTAKKLQAYWEDLSDEEASTADRAILKLTAAPAQSVPFLKQMLKPKVNSIDAKGIDKLIADLDSNQFVVREKAMQELDRLGRLVEPALKKALATQQPSLELRRRMERLLEKMEGPVSSPDLLRSLRALEVLEEIGSSEARQIIESLAKGSPDDELTQQAQAALARLAKRR